MPILGPTTNHREIRSWAEEHKVVPTELLPDHVDHEPVTLQLISAKTARQRKDVLVLSWDEFFARFDLLGLAFVYDGDHSGYNELLQRDERAPGMAEANLRHRLKN